MVTAADDANWILTCQTPSGAIAWEPITAGSDTVIPYQAAYGAWGLACAYALTGTRTYLNAAWNHLAWHASVMPTSTSTTGTYRPTSTFSTSAVPTSISVQSGSQTGTARSADLLTVTTSAGSAWIKYTSISGSAGAVTAFNGCTLVYSSAVGTVSNSSNTMTTNQIAGVVDDFSVGAGPTYTLTSQGNGSYDSSDATAAMWLVALQSAYNVSGNLTMLRQFGPSSGGGIYGTAGAIANAYNAINATTQSSGYTQYMMYATPTYAAALTFDMAECYAGLLACAYLSGLVGDTTTQTNATNAASNLKSAFTTKLYDTTPSVPQPPIYDWAANAGGNTLGLWSNQYPDAMANVWACYYGLADSTKVAALTQAFFDYHPEWPGFQGGGWNVFPALLLPTSQAAWFLAAIRYQADAVARAYPYTVSTAGELLVLNAYASGVSSVPTPMYSGPLAPYNLVNSRADSSTMAVNHASDHDGQANAISDLLSYALHIATKTPEFYGALGNGFTSTTGTLTASGGAGHWTLSDSNYTFTSADVGKYVTIPSLTPANILVTTIASVAGGVATLTGTSSASSGTVTYTCGTDDTTALQSWATHGGNMLSPGKMYLLNNATLTWSSVVHIDLNGSTIKLIGNQANTTGAVPANMISFSGTTGRYSIDNGTLDGSLSSHYANFGSYFGASRTSAIQHGGSTPGNSIVVLKAGLTIKNHGYGLLSTADVELSGCSIVRDSNLHNFESLNGGSSYIGYGVVAIGSVRGANPKILHYGGGVLYQTTLASGTSVFIAGLESGGTIVDSNFAISTTCSNVILLGVKLGGAVFNATGTVATSPVAIDINGGNNVSIFGPDLSGMTAPNCTGGAFLLGILIQSSNDVHVVNPNLSNLTSTGQGYGTAVRFNSCTRFSLEGGEIQLPSGEDGAIVVTGSSDGLIAPGYLLGASGGYEGIIINTSSNINIKLGECVNGAYGVGYGIVCFSGASHDCTVEGGRIDCRYNFQYSSTVVGAALYQAGSCNRIKFKNITIDNAFTGTITGVSSTGSAATTITVGTAYTTPSTGQTVTITGVAGSAGTAVNGTWVATYVDATHFTIPVMNSAAYTSGGSYVLLLLWCLNDGTCTNTLYENITLTASAYDTLSITGPAWAANDSVSSTVFRHDNQGIMASNVSSGIAHSYTTASSSLAAIDTTQAAISFTTNTYGPGSNKVCIQASGFMDGSAGGVTLALLNDSGGAQVGSSFGGSSATAYGPFLVEFVVSSLLPNTAYKFDLAWAANDNSTTITIRRVTTTGAESSTPSSDGAPIVMKCLAA